MRALIESERLLEENRRTGEMTDDVHYWCYECNGRVEVVIEKRENEVDEPKCAVCEGTFVEQRVTNNPMNRQMNRQMTRAPIHLPEASQAPSPDQAMNVIPVSDHRNTLMYILSNVLSTVRARDQPSPSEEIGADTEEGRREPEVPESRPNSMSIQFIRNDASVSEGDGERGNTFMVSTGFPGDMQSFAAFTEGGSERSEDMYNFMRMLLPMSLDKGNPRTNASMIQHLQKHKRKLSEEELQHSKECPVCQENFKLETEIIDLACAHSYCETCIIPWLEKRNTCPVCRTEINVGEEQQGVAEQAQTEVSTIVPPATTGAPTETPRTTPES